MRAREWKHEARKLGVMGVESDNDQRQRTTTTTTTTLFMRLFMCLRQPSLQGTERGPSRMSPHPGRLAAVSYQVGELCASVTGRDPACDYLVTARLSIQISCPRTELSPEANLYRSQATDLGSHSHPQADQGSPRTKGHSLLQLRAKGRVSRRNYSQR